MNIINLKYIIKQYLRDAGFAPDDYELYDSTYNYIEIIFNNSDAVNYIIIDIEKTKYSEKFEILDYKYNTGKITAIITCREDDIEKK